MVLNWQKSDYFSQLMLRDKRAHPALEMLVDDLHTDKDRTITKFLCHSGSEDFLWGLVTLLGSDNSRVAGNSAYILGTLAESENGCFRVLSLTSHSHPDARRILPDLTNMLLFEDPESVMNAAGTMGTLAESQEGRQWMLSEPCLENTIQYITDLLNNENLWTASNAALVLARLTISEEGCEQILNHQASGHVLAKLIQSLGVDEAGRGMNAAFAIGRLCDMEAGRSRLLGLPDSERMVSLLAKMLCCTDPGASKNACFALSCLATSKEGHSRLLKNSHSDDVLRTLSELLSSEDGETGWFAAMTLRTLASQPKGCLRLRDHPSVLVSLKNVQSKSDVNEDLHDEVVQTLQILKRLAKPQPPRVSVEGATEISVSWEPSITKSGFQIRYQLFEGTKCIYHGKDTEYYVKGCTPHTSYSFRLRSATEGDDSPLSDVITVITEESTPDPPANVRILACTTTQLKIGWDPPQYTNGILKGYYVYNGDKAVEHTYETHSIITGLQPSSANQIAVCAATSKGKGPKVEITGTTVELGAHAPTKPEVTVRGRFELHISWKPPEVPLGKITRYDVRMNGEVIYSGMDLHYDARRLKPDTEYTVTVSAITNEGKCESKASKKRTAKDDYEGERAPLYQPPRKEPSAEMDRREDMSPSKSPTKRSRKEPVFKARSASAASTKTRLALLWEDKKKYLKLALSSQKAKSGTVSPPPGRAKMAVARLLYTHQAHPLVQTKKDEKVADSSPETSRPVSTFARKEDQSKHQDDSDQIPQRSHTTISQHSRPKSHRVTSSTTRGHTDNSGKTTPSKPQPEVPPSSHEQSGRNTPKLQSELSSVSYDSRRMSNPSPKPGRKVLPKPKPPNVRKPRRASQTLLQSRSSDNLDPNSSLNSNSGSTVNSGNATQNGTYSAVQNSKQSENGDQRENAAMNADSADSQKGGKMLPKPRQLREWTNTPTQRGASRRPMLKKRLPLSGSIDEGGGVDGDPESVKPSVSAAQSNKSYDYQKADEHTPAGPGTTYTTLSGGHFRPADAMHRSKTGMVEFEAPLPQPSQTSGMTPSYVQRTNTYIDRQRAPGRRSVGSMRSSHPLTSNQSAPQSGGQQWTPDFPSQGIEKSHSKFVPMQFRTQPANLPGVMRRQATQMGYPDRVGSSLEVVQRSKTELGITNHAPTVTAKFLDQSEQPRHLSTGHGQYINSSHTPRERDANTAGLRGFPSHEQHGAVRHLRSSSGAYHAGARGAPARAAANQQQPSQTVMSLAVNQSTAPQTKLQSAR